MNIAKYLTWGLIGLLGLGACDALADSQQPSCDITIDAQGTWAWAGDKQTDCWFPAGMEFREDGTWVAVAE